MTIEHVDATFTKTCLELGLLKVDQVTCFCTGPYIA